MPTKCETCIHATEKGNGKYECDISHFEVDGTHCASCVSYEDIRDFHVCDNCNELKRYEDLRYIGNECICIDCLNNGYGE